MKPNIGKINRTAICMLQHCQGTNEKRHYCPLTPDISEHYHFHFLVTHMVRGGTKDSKCAAESQEKHSSKGVETVLCIPTNKLFLVNFTVSFSLYFRACYSTSSVQSQTWDPDSHTPLDWLGFFSSITESRLSLSVSPWEISSTCQPHQCLSCDGSEVKVNGYLTLVLSSKYREADLVTLEGDLRQQQKLESPHVKPYRTWNIQSHSGALLFNTTWLWNKMSTASRKG